jgi:tartrate dehydratase alpha subunit/fumarate hydratase class I-like protein
MKTHLSKKEIRHNLETALISEIEKMEGSESSKKIKRVIRKASKGIALKVKLDMKRRVRKASKRNNKESDREFNTFLVETVETSANGHS